MLNFILFAVHSAYVLFKNAVNIVIKLHFFIVIC
nr:MAG TPA: hypothetical protein [Caudoviricetes sp.]